MRILLILFLIFSPVQVSKATGMFKNFFSKKCKEKPFHECIGTEIDPKSFEIYEGEWLNGKKHGKGEINTPTGHVHKVYYNNGKLHGPFESISPAGLIWRGTYIEGSLEGNWIKIHKSGEITEMTYENNRLVGIMKVIKPSGHQIYYNCDKAKKQKDGRYICPFDSQNTR